MKTLSSIMPVSIIGPDVMLADLTLDSREVMKDFLFCAVKGDQSDGHQFINKAISKGAVAIALESDVDIESGITKVIIPDLKQQIGGIARKFFSDPSQSLVVIGVTGTNGKSTTSDYIRQLLDSLGCKCMSIGTLGVRFQNNTVSLRNTTPDVITLNRTLFAAINAKQEAVVMEVSSHALMQNRVSGLSFDIAIFTNISQDHLDYHGNMANYVDAKSRLFGYESLKCAIINIDDFHAHKMIKKLKPSVKIIRFSLENPRADVFLKNIEQGKSGYACVLSYEGCDFNVCTQVVGRFNLYNLIASIIAVKEQGADLKNIINQVNKILPVEGRMQSIENELGAMIVVDFAHTPDALRNILSTVKSESSGNLYVVFGCGGDRDKDKRPLMGAIAEELSDYSWVTSDNPRSESEHAICQDIVSGMNNNKHEIIIDRKKAIFSAVDSLKPGDYLVVAGKGHEKFQQIQDIFTPFDDVEIIKDALAQKGES